MDINSNKIIFSIVTPSYNQEKFIAKTIDSVISQEGDFYINYTIMDGGSTDGTLNILESYREGLETGAIKIKCKGVNFNFVSERDGGQYSAINNGFARTPGNIMAWINSDDFYTPWAFSVVADVCSTHQEIEWLTGMPLLFNQKGQAINAPINKGFSARLFYDGAHINDGKGYSRGWIGQDSIFWHRNLWERVGSALDPQYDFAADFKLWALFFKEADLYSVRSPLAGFRIHPEQKTANQNKYNDQANEILASLGGRRFSQSETKFRAFARNNLLETNTGRSFLRSKGLLDEGRLVVFDQKNHKWQIQRIEIF